MRARVLLQPTYTLAAAAQQEARFAKPVGHGKTGVAIVNVYRKASTGTVTFQIETASQKAVRADTTNPFWVNCYSSGTSVLTGAAANGIAVKFKIADLGEFIRWNVNTPESIDFDITVYLSDT